VTLRVHILNSYCWGCRQSGLFGVAQHMYFLYDTDAIEHVEKVGDMVEGWLTCRPMIREGDDPRYHTDSPHVREYLTPVYWDTRTDRTLVQEYAWHWARQPPAYRFKTGEIYSAGQ
jgi:hypothetical protein